MAASTEEPDLGALHRAGRLTAEYPRVRRLLDGLSGDALLRAGRLLATLDPDAVRAAHPGVPAVRIAVTGHGTLHAMGPALTAELARHGLLARLHTTDFDSWIFALTDTGSDLYTGDPDLVVCVLDHRIVLDDLPSPWTAADAEAVLDTLVTRVERLTERFTAHARGTLVLNTLPLPRTATAQLVDHRSRARLAAAWHSANARLLRLTQTHDAVAVIDLAPLLAEGVPATDPRMSAYAKAHLSDGLLAAHARETAHLARNLAGLTRKALVVDLDGTLWGGVLGDDGADGIQVGEGHRGEAYTAFQHVVRQLTSQGVLLAAVSKNDAGPVKDVLAGHPGMTLRDDDFVRVTANWRPKHENIADLAAALNLATDAFVFVDDSPYERGLVRRELPGVAVVDLDDEPALHPAALLADGWFDTRVLTGEDRARTAQYRDELARTDFLGAFDSLDDYLSELGVRVTVAPAADPDVPRLSQLTLRTNQFNLTTRRLQPHDVTALLTAPGTLTLTVRSADRFGDNGLVGALFAHDDGDTLTVDNMLLSCRVFSRGIERSVLAALLAHARGRGLTAVRGTYTPTAKNAGVRDLYAQHGFHPEPAADHGTEHWRHDLDPAVIPHPPGHVHLTATFPERPTPGRAGTEGARP